MPRTTITTIIFGLFVLSLVLPQLIQAQVAPVFGVPAPFERPEASIARQERIQNESENEIGTGGFFSNMWNGFLAVVYKALGMVIYGISYLLGMIAGILFTFAGLFLSYGLQLNGSLLDSPTVNIGWRISRDIVNLGFVLGIIFIAIATILRQSKYGMKGNLIRLIVAALLINFSLTIAGIFIDLSGLMTNFFIAKVVPPAASVRGAGDNMVQFASALANSFGVQGLLEVSGDKIKNFQGITEFGAGMLQSIATLVFIFLFTFAAATTMLAIAFLVYARYVALTILLILMPFAWLGWVFKETKAGEMHSQWWNKFMEWIIWLPVASFFIYLTVLIVTNQAKDPNSLAYLANAVQQAPQGNALETTLTLLKNSFATFGRMAAIIGLLGGGLLAAGRISGTGAKVAMDAAKSTGGWLSGAVAGAAGYGARRTGQAMLRSRGRPAQIDEKTGKPIEGTERAPLGQRLATGLSRLGFSGAASTLSNYLAGSAEQVKKYREQFLDKLSDSALMAYSELGGPIAIAAKYAELAKRNKIDKALKEGNISQRQLERAMEAIRKTGTEKDFLSNQPRYAQNFGKTIEGAMKKITDVTAVGEENFSDAEVLANLSAAQLKTLGSSDKVSEELREKIRTGIRNARTAILTKANTEHRTLTDEENKKVRRLKYAKRLTLTPSWTIKELKQELTDRYDITEKSAKQIVSATKEVLAGRKPASVRPPAAPIPPQPAPPPTQQPPPPAQPPPPSRAEQLALRQKLEERIRIRREDLEYLRQSDEQRPTVLKSTEEALKRAERELDTFNKTV